MAPTTELIDNAQAKSAKELDQRIRECLRDYVQLGKLLMEMRDGQAYRLVGPYDTFEDYCKDVEGLAYSVAKEKVRAYLVHKAIEENLGAGISPPRIESQVTQLFAHDTAIAKFKTEKRIVHKRDGTNTPVEVPVAVSNPKKVAEQWAAIVKDYEETVSRAEKRHQEESEKAKETGEPSPAFKRPKLTGNFVVNHLPPMYQPTRFASDGRHDFIKWVSGMSKQAEKIATVQGQGERESAKWQRMVQLPERKKLNKVTIPQLIENINEVIDILKLFKKDLSDEFADFIE